MINYKLNDDFKSYIIIGGTQEKLLSLLIIFDRLIFVLELDLDYKETQTKSPLPFVVRWKREREREREREAFGSVRLGDLDEAIKDSKWWSAAQLSSLKLETWALMLKERERGKVMEAKRIGLMGLAKMVERVLGRRS